MKRLLALLGLLACCCPLRGRAADASHSVAVIPGDGERAPQEAVVAKLEAALSAEKAVSLVERAKVRAILAEQKLSAAGLNDPATAAKLGQVLNAELFVFVENVPRVQPPACRVQMIEARTGIALGTALAGEAALMADLSPAIGAVRLAVEKLRVPDGERRAVGILSVRSEEAGSLLDGLAEALAMLLLSDLGASPALIVLDREHLDTLRTEKDLSGADLKLKASLLLLDVGLKRVPGEERLAVTAQLKPLQGGEGERIVLAVPAKDVGAARQALAAAVRDKLKAAAPSLAPADPQGEAAVFAERGGILLRHQEYGPAIRAAEAALALDPRNDYRALAAECWQNMANWGMDKLPKEERALPIYRAALRKCELSRAAIEEHIAAWKRGEHVRIRLPSGTYNPATYIKLKPDEKEAREIKTLLKDICLASYRAELDYYAARRDDLDDPRYPNYRPAASEWWRALQQAPNYCAYWTDDAAEFVALMKEMVLRQESPPGPLEQDLPYGGICSSLAQLQVLREKFTAPEERRRVEELLDWITQRKSPSLRIAGWCAITHLHNERRQEAARKALDTFLAEVPVGHPERGRGDSFFPIALTNEGLYVFAEKDNAEAARYRDALIRPLVASEETCRLSAWDDTVGGWVADLEKAGRVEDACNAAKRIVGILGKPAYNTHDHAARLLSRYLGDKAAALEAKLKGRVAIPEAWKAFDFIPIQIGQLTEGMELAALCSHKDRLFLVWTPEWRYGVSLELRATAVSVNGGAQVSLGRIVVKRLDESWTNYEQVTCLAADDAGLYAGTRDGGLAMFREGKGTALSEEKGAPGVKVSALACYAGKVYVSFGEPWRCPPCAFAEFDPATGEFAILASSRWQEKRHDLDGGEPYAMGALLPDEKRKCIWLAVSENAGLSRRGLWRFLPETKQFQKAKADDCQISKLAWSGGKMLTAFLNFTSLGLADPAAEGRTALIGSYQSAGSRGRPWFGDPKVKSTWPCVLAGDQLLAADDCLFLHTGGGEPLALRQAPDGRRLAKVRFVQELGDGILVGTLDGDLWLVRRKAGAADAAKPAQKEQR
ncbi:MAG: hypothetical protein NTW87_07685 [Planctomycetota bacterium]|nr:hypothetical protein [Planctomycetota bacterium]